MIVTISHLMYRELLWEEKANIMGKEKFPAIYTGGLSLEYL